MDDDDDVDDIRASAQISSPRSVTQHIFTSNCGNEIKLNGGSLKDGDADDDDDDEDTAPTPKSYKNVVGVRYKISSFVPDHNNTDVIPET